MTDVNTKPTDALYSGANVPVTLAAKVMRKDPMFIVDRINALGFDFKNITEVIKAVWDGLCKFLKPVFEGVFQQIANIFKVVTDVILNVLDVFIGIFTGDWSKVWDGIWESTITNILFPASSSAVSAAASSSGRRRVAVSHGLAQHIFIIKMPVP